VALEFSVEELFHPDPLGTHIPRQLCSSKQINRVLLGVRYGPERCPHACCTTRKMF